MDIKNVLVPTDFSLPAGMAINYAVALARKFQARLTLLHVLEPVQPTADLGADPEKGENAQREGALRKLWSTLAPEDEDDLNLQVVLKSGKVQQEITAAARDYNADVVVLGTHGRGRLGRLILGSTTEGLLRKLATPVISVCNVAVPMAFNRVLFATDLSESSRRGFDVALALANKLQAKIVAVHVLNTTLPDEGAETAAAETREIVISDARRRLASLISEGRTHGVEVQTLLAEGVPAEEILNAAKRNSADLILMTVGRKPIVERTLLGTTAEHVVREAGIPVLSIPIHTGVQPERTGQVR